MHATFILGALTASAIAIPTNFTRPIGLDRPIWLPKADTLATCDGGDDKFIPTSSASNVADQICKEMIRPCGWPDRPDDIVCTMALDQLRGPKSVMLKAPVSSLNSLTELSGWTANFTVRPNLSQNTPSVDWTPGDCVGYFNKLLLESKPAGCSIEGRGAGRGSLTVTGETLLRDTVFSVDFQEGK